jgi:hypothetical protein
MTTRKCNKVRFPDELAAMLALNKRSNSEKGEIRHYRCPRCRGWHLTSQPKRVRKGTWVYTPNDSWLAPHIQVRYVDGVQQHYVPLSEQVTPPDQPAQSDRHP